MTPAAAAAVGFVTSFSLILAIGAQNAFVLRQGLMREHVFAVCLTCGLSDAILITAGVAGFGAIVATWPWLTDLMLWGGAVFLVVYGALRFRAAFRGESFSVSGGAAAPLSATLATCLALTWLNPHVYLDTFALIGSVSAQFEQPSEKAAFAIGAIAASFTFFFALGYGSRLLVPLMRTPRTWQILDIGIGLVMWAIAAGLIASAIR
jgi:L-lysine exporter family protein LysE/ArgO